MSGAQGEQKAEPTGMSDEIVVAELVEIDLGKPPVGGLDANGPFGVPTRFGIGTLLVVTAAYGALLALLQSLDWDRRAIVWIIVFISLVGTGQMLLFGSQRPRRASMITGAICLPIIVVLATFLHASRRGPRFEPGCGLISGIVFGALAGYLAGGVVAGVFLIMDAVQRGLSRQFPPKATDDESRN